MPTPLSKHNGSAAAAPVDGVRCMAACVAGLRRQPASPAIPHAHIEHTGALPYTTATAPVRASLMQQLRLRRRCGERKARSGGTRRRPPAGFGLGSGPASCMPLLHRVDLAFTEACWASGLRVRRHENRWRACRHPAWPGRLPASMHSTVPHPRPLRLSLAQPTRPCKAFPPAPASTCRHRPSRPTAAAPHSLHCSSEHLGSSAAPVPTLAADQPTPRSPSLRAPGQAPSARRGEAGARAGWQRPPPQWRHAAGRRAPTVSLAAGY